MKSKIAQNLSKDVCLKTVALNAIQLQSNCEVIYETREAVFH